MGKERISSFCNGLSLSIRLDKCTQSFIHLMDKCIAQRKTKHLAASRVTLIDFHLQDTQSMYNNSDKCKSQGYYQKLY